MKAKPITKPVPLVVLPLATDAATLRNVRAAGYCPILTDSPDSVRVILPGNDVSGSDMLMSALHGLCGLCSDEGRSDFAKELFHRMKTKEIANK